MQESAIISKTFTPKFFIEQWGRECIIRSRPHKNNTQHTLTSLFEVFCILFVCADQSNYRSSSCRECCICRHHRHQGRFSVSLPLIQNTTSHFNIHISNSNNLTASQVTWFFFFGGGWMKHTTVICNLVIHCCAYNTFVCFLPFFATHTTHFEVKPKIQFSLLFVFCCNFFVGHFSPWAC